METENTEIREDFEWKAFEFAHPYSVGEDVGIAP
jgi:hypothetical protein